ncbi:MAG: PDZ domain-containing protein [Chthoniobacterales bacterium]
MKKQVILTTTLAALLPLLASAQSPAPGAAQPAQQPIPALAPPAPPVPPVPPVRHLRDDGPKEPVTFLGVETSDVPRVLSEQMGLPRGFGVVVDYVVPNSPAAAAGVQQSDIIRMLNDQIIVDPGQLGKLVRSFADGTTVSLTLLRKGQEVKVTVKLAKHDVPSGHGPFGFEKEWNFDDLDKMNFDFQMPDMTAVREAVQRAKAEAMRAGDEARQAARRLRIVTTDDETTKSTRVDLGKATITFSDDQGELKLERVNGKKMLTARDAQGKELFKGPIDTEEERAKIPANVRERFEKLEKQELPEIPPAPEAPRAPDDGGESAHLQDPRFERATFSPNDRTGWRRSTFRL